MIKDDIEVPCQMPLVSVIVITYNSSKYVKETLDSIARQTYTELQLIVSDDCSTDDTLNICKDWINLHQNLFKGGCKIAKTYENKGICGNYNWALEFADGEWIKYIAGDDLLKKDCIETFVNFCKNHSEKFLICKECHFSSLNNNTSVAPNDITPWIKPFKSVKKRVKYQILYLLRHGTVIPGPTIFLHRLTLINLGGFDEKYPFIEDFPLAMKYLDNGFPIGCVDKVLIDYRVYPESVSHSDCRFAQSIFGAIDDYCMHMALKVDAIYFWYHYWLKQKIRQRTINKFLGYFLTIFDIVNWKKKFLKARNP